jgi:hypothetical protein
MSEGALDTVRLPLCVQRSQDGDAEVFQWSKIA